MDAISAAREFGKAIQQDERYLRIRKAQQESDDSPELQEKIEVFNRVRGELNAEVQKQEKDTDRIKELDANLKDSYQEIINHPMMVEYAAAREELQSMLAFINQIITASANGMDPATVEFQEDCTTDCNTCAGC